VRTQGLGALLAGDDDARELLARVKLMSALQEGWPDLGEEVRGCAWVCVGVPAGVPVGGWVRVRVLVRATHTHTNTQTHKHTTHKHTHIHKHKHTEA